MKFTLQELLKQKGLLENHLAWLNSKIQELKSETPEKSETTAPSGSLSPGDEFSVETTQSVDSGDEVIAETLTQQFQAPQGVSSQSMKVGCIVLVIGLCLFFLLALFVLPNWLYSN